MTDHAVHREIRQLIAVTIGVIVAIAVLIFAVYTFFKSSYSFDYRALNTTNIPDYSIQSQPRKDILTIVEQELNNPGDMYKYTEGTKEPWCADFVSWVYNQAGHGFENPNSGSWRIPGTYTLQEYFKKENRWHAYDSELPQPGDVIIYRHGIFGEHTNIVVTTDYDEILTVGGNENGRIMLHRIKYSDKRYGIIGFGVAPEEDLDESEE